MCIHYDPVCSSFSKGQDQVKKKSGQLSIVRYKKSLALKELERETLEAKQRKYPNVPYPVGESFDDKTANGTTKAIIALLRLRGHQAERINTMGRPIDRTKTFNDVLGNTRMIGRMEWIKSTGTVGSADISATIKSISVKIEVKHGRDVQSEAQFRYQQEVEAAGGYYVIAKTYDGFLEWYNQHFGQ